MKYNIKQKILECIKSKQVDLLATELQKCYKLQLHSCNLGDEDIAILVKALANNNSVKSINLVNNRISNIGARALATTNVSKLILKFNNIGDLGAAALARNTCVIELFLEINPITNKGASEFLNNKTVIRLALPGEDINDETRQQLNTRVRANYKSINNVIDEIIDKARNNASHLSLKTYQVIEELNIPFEILIERVKNKVNETQYKDFDIEKAKKLVGLRNFHEHFFSVNGICKDNAQISSYDLTNAHILSYIKPSEMYKPGEESFKYREMIETQRRVEVRTR